MKKRRHGKIRISSEMMKMKNQKMTLGRRKNRRVADGWLVSAVFWRE